MTGRQGGAGPGTGGHSRPGGRGGHGGRGGPPGSPQHGGPRHRRLGCADLKAVPEVRRVLRDLLRQWGGPDTADVAQLLASELVTNALVHTDHGAVVTATVASSTLRVEVRDFMAGLPLAPVPPSGQLDMPDVLDAHGRGLVLVQNLADSWGVRTQGVGKVIWFELYERPARESRAGLS
ncbi:ATP-binding protein [Streptomyces sp. NPDC020965]|uniref:ATP-binding protein n=1 Tax=Streptomyces sp. NPDC020965 TaxID=3365105 RepID=UPI0037BB838D